MESQCKQRVFTGVVTQLQDHFGMVDQEVHFQMSVVIGRIPQLGEKVLVKAVLDPSVSVNWTAQRVQTLNGQPFKSPPPLLPSMVPSQKPGILGSKPQPLLKSPKIPPLIPSMQQNTPKPGLLQTPLQPPWGGPFDGWGGANRKRPSDGIGGRRTGRWEDSGAWGGDGVHQKRRRWRGALDEGVVKKSSPPAPQSCPLFSRFPRDGSACDSLEMQRRYPHLPLPDSFFHLQLSWTESFPPDRPLTLPGPCRFHVGSSQSPAPVASAAGSGAEYTAKVILLSVPSVEELCQRCCGLSQEHQDTAGGAVHPTALIKFLLGEAGGELQVLGGHWCPQEDGVSPAKEPLSLVRTAVRCVKEQAGLDLGPCSQWFRLAEVRYLSAEKVETVVFFLPDVWRIVPTEEEWAALRTKADGVKEEDESPLPGDPSLVLHPCSGLNLSALPLSSLLEPRNSQSRDAFEVGLVAELFSEMLQRDFGLQIYRSLCSLSQCPQSKEDEGEDSRAAAAEDKPQTTVKGKRKSDMKNRKWKHGRQQMEGEAESEEDQGEDETDEELEERSHEEEEKKGRETKTTGDDGKMQPVTSANSDSTPTKKSEQPLCWSAVLPRSLLLAWVFFDRQLTGSLRERDLQDLLLSLGLHLSPGQAKELASRATIGGQCHYRRLAGHWENLEVKEDSLSGRAVQGNASLLASAPSKGSVSTRRSGGSNSVDTVTYKGTVVNIPNLLHSLKKEESKCQGLEQRVASLQARLVELESGAVALSALREGQEDLQVRLERAERRNTAYERSLKENAGHMIAVIEKMQKLVDKTTSLAEARSAGVEKV
ncbi:cell cycle and apoptosis regulator protein 2 isoform X2 [Scleropages formosus]|nr:cell cycle and apoptosis regulator protein 2-like isoform X2 [Scleropages formosus]XP_029108987.1 cell cycle and apoptosis regulator protein 2-like isoform X2 [Scleropages formosus]